LKGGNQFVVSLLLLALSLLAAGQVMAQPARGRIISDVTVTDKVDRIELGVEFTFPVRYMGHFPEDYGDTIEIQLKAVVVSEVDAGLLPRSESIRLPEAGSVPLLDISYEGDLPGGPYLTVRFHDPVAFTVKQGTDFRSLMITVFNNTSSE
jgi:hypothetical protein